MFRRAMLAAAAASTRTTSSPSAASSSELSPFLRNRRGSPRSYSSPPEQGQQRQPRRQRARWLLFLPPAAAAFLCHWQLERRSWKAALLEERERALKAEPLTLDEVLSSAASRGRGSPGEGVAPEMTRVVVHGVENDDDGDGDSPPSFELDASRTFLVGPRPRSFGGSTVGGSLVVTPLLRRRRRRAPPSSLLPSSSRDESSAESDDDGRQGALLIRGWVPSGWSEGAGEGGGRGERAGRRRKRKKEPSSPLLCVLRGSETPSRFVPDNDPSQNKWHWVDREAMAVAAGLPRDSPLLEVVSTSPSSSVDDGGDDGGGESEEPRNEPKRPSLMEVLGGRTAERGSGSPLVSEPRPTSTSPSPSSPSERRRRGRQRPPQPRTLEEISQVSVSPGQHLQYAATWGTLAGATALLAVKVARK